MTREDETMSTALHYTGGDKQLLKNCWKSLSYVTRQFLEVANEVINVLSYQNEPNTPFAELA